MAIINTTYEIEYPLSCALFLHGVAKNNAHFYPFFEIEPAKRCTNETPTVHGLAADNNNKLYTETMIFLWNNHYNLNFIM